MHSDFIVFADESGDHSLTNVSREYPVFVLSFCIIKKSDYIESVSPLLQRFKFRWWAHDGVVLHSMRIRRQEPPFVFLKSIEKRERFMADLTDTLAKCPFTLIAGVIHKARLREQYVQPENPYSIALRFCLERAHEFFLEQDQVQRQTGFLFECRGRKEDAELAIVFRTLCERLSLRGRMPKFSIEFFEKKANLLGLQVADLVSTPIGRHISQPQKSNRAFEMVQRKFVRRPNGDFMGTGLRVFP